MRLVFFKVFAKLNKLILPRFSKKNIYKLSRSAKLIVAYRYWITKNSLE